MMILALIVALFSLVLCIFGRLIPPVKTMRTVAPNIAWKAAAQPHGVAVASQC